MDSAVRFGFVADVVGRKHLLAGSGAVSKWRKLGGHKTTFILVSSDLTGERTYDCAVNGETDWD